jgi:hypothetical protein
MGSINLLSVDKKSLLSKMDCWRDALWDNMILGHRYWTLIENLLLQNCNDLFQNLCFVHCWSLVSVRLDIFPNRRVHLGCHLFDVSVQTKVFALQTSSNNRDNAEEAVSHEGLIIATRL